MFDVMFRDEKCACANRRCETRGARRKVRDAPKRLSRAQFMPHPSQIPAETLQRRKIKVVYAPKSGRNFTRLYRKSRLRNLIRQKLYSGVKKKSFPRQKTTKTLQPRKIKVVYAPKSGKNFTRLYRKSRLHALIRQKLYSGVKKKPPTRERRKVEVRESRESRKSKVGLMGFEPTTFCSGGRRSIH